MEQNDSTPFPSRPIILSPPPLNSRAAETFHSRRQQSVGYNLQHEFETLNADLDLDLKDDYSGHNSSENNSSQVSIAVSHSMPGSSNMMSDGMGSVLGSIGASLGSVQTGVSNSHSQFVNTISPIPTTVNASQAGLGSLLNQRYAPSLGLPQHYKSVDDYNLFQNQNIQSPPVSARAPEIGTEMNSTNFYSELMRFTNWIAALNSQDNYIMVDYLCNHLPFDTLMKLKSKIDQTLPNQPLTNQEGGYQKHSYSNMSSYNYDLNDLEHLNLNNDPVLHQPVPKQNDSRALNSIGHNSFQNVYQQGLESRPRSADYNLRKTTSNQRLDRAKSPANHLFEKTNFLNYAAARSPGLGPNSEDGLTDMSQKLGALLTINSRVVLDSNKKNHNSHYFDPSGRTTNSNSVPLSNSQNQGKTMKTPPNRNPNFKAQNRTSPNSYKPEAVPPVLSNSSMPLEIASIELLNNIPAWLKLLRLHKYTDCLKDIPWKQLIELDDTQLEDKGVKALGARRKLLKAFDVIKNSSII